MAAQVHQVETLEVMIEEYKRTHDWLDNAYDRIKVKTLTFLGGGLATLTFQYADGDTFIPPQTYGKIFYFGGLASMLAALVLLFMALLPRHWEFSIESKDIKRVEVYSHLEYLKYVRERYIVAYKMNLK